MNHLTLFSFRCPVVLKVLDCYVQDTAKYYPTCTWRPLRMRTTAVYYPCISLRLYHIDRRKVRLIVIQYSQLTSIFLDLSANSDTKIKILPLSCYKDSSKLMANLLSPFKKSFPAIHALIRPCRSLCPALGQVQESSSFPCLPHVHRCV